MLSVVYRVCGWLDMSSRSCGRPPVCLCRVSNGVKASTAAEVQAMGRDDVGESAEGWG